MGVYNLAKSELLKGNLDLVNDTIKAMLVGTGYSFDPDHDYVDDGIAGDPASHELTSVSNYARVTLSGLSVTEDDANDEAYWDAADAEFTSLGNGTNDTVAAIIIFRVGPTNDTDALLIEHISIGNFTTDGKSIKFIWSPNGILRAA